MALLIVFRISVISLIMGILTSCGGGGGGTITENRNPIPDIPLDVKCETPTILDFNYRINGKKILNNVGGGANFGIYEDNPIIPPINNIGTQIVELEATCYLTELQLQIPENVQLIIPPNTTIMFGNRESGLTVLGGSIIADGAPTAPIFFTGKGDNPIKWAGIRVYRRDFLENIFDHVLIEHAGSGHFSFTNAAFSVAHHPNDSNQEKGRITFTNNVIRKTAPQSQTPSYAFLAQQQSYFKEISNNIFYDNPVHPISITVNEAHFIDQSNKFQYAGIGNLKNNIVIKNSLLGNNNDEILDTLNRPEAYNTPEVTWQRQEIPYLLEDNIQISHTTLNIQAGAELQFIENAGLRIVGSDAALSAIGTSSQMITFTKADDPPETSSWLGIHFNNSSSFKNNLSYTNILFGGGDRFKKANLVLIESAQVSVSNSNLQQSLNGYGIDVDRTSRFNNFSNNTISLNEAGAGLVAVQALSSLDISTDYRGNFRDYLHVNTDDGSIDGSASMPGINAPYAFFDDFYVNGSLTISPGAELLFAEGKVMEIRSNVLTAIGEPGNPILFASLEPLLSTNISYWDGLLFNSSAGSTLQYIIVRNGGFRDGFNNGQAGIRIISNNQPFSRVQIDNTTVEILDLNAHGIFVDNNSTMTSSNRNLNNIANGICEEPFDICR